MWSNLSERIKHIVKIIAIVMIAIAMLGTSAIILMMYLGEKESNKRMQAEIESMQNTITEYENVIVTQRAELDEYTRRIEETVHKDEETGTLEMSTIDILNNELSLLQNGDTTTIKAWFGLGSEYTPENVIDATQYAKVYVTEDKKAPEGYISIHICNIDYRLKEQEEEVLRKQYIKKNVAMSEKDREEIIADKLKIRIEEKEFDKHFHIYVKSTDGILDISEDLKQAVTGGWYLGTKEPLQSWFCNFNK